MVRANNGDLPGAIARLSRRRSALIPRMQTPAFTEAWPKGKSGDLPGRLSTLRRRSASIPWMQKPAFTEAWPKRIAAICPGDYRLHGGARLDPKNGRCLPQSRHGKREKRRFAGGDRRLHGGDPPRSEECDGLLQPRFFARQNKGPILKGRSPTQRGDPPDPK